MPNNWKTYKLSELTNKIGSGATPRGGKEAYKDSGISLIRSQNVLDFSFSTNGLAFIDEKQAEGLKNVTVESRDVLLNITGDSVARVCQVPEKWLPARVNQHVAIVRANREKLSPEFLKYSLLSKANKEYLLTLASAGATRNAITKSMIEDFEISIPDLKEQKAIASILSSLDDKIELNLQMNKTLEEMAMTMYKHWFVDFGPFKDGKFIDSELGPIPEGWEVLPLSEITSKITDGAHHSPKSVENGYPMASVKDMTDWGFTIDTCRKISDNDYQKLVAQGCQPRKDDILIAKDGSYLKHAFVVERDLDIALLSSIAILKPNFKMHPHLINLYLKLDEVKERMKSIVSGAVIQRIVLKDFRKFSVLVPEIKVQKEVLETINPLISQCWLNNSENQTLTNLRDTLLPKLISGEVGVKDVEQKVAEVL
ncbi:restriction endonuclease subunit S [Fulvivirga lutea]|uniref:Restriction endonuclease subunit S n=1 Tax=Fulvivirga lutea TaxID=2810512 RepID=A0A974WJ08_9BACT|nr:restriction endonuclease subunit S [Fulvivirga lutea]QSE98648.1 restriction endonuclease subunit S [Fulvivirga lutea]